MTESLAERIIIGSIEIERARDGVCRLLAVITPALRGNQFVGEKFRLQKNESKFWWELRRGRNNTPFLQLWTVLNRNAYPYWEYEARNKPPAEKTMIVYESLDFLLKACCERHIEGFREVVEPYLQVVERLAISKK